MAQASDSTAALHTTSDDVPEGMFNATIACTIAVDGGSVDAEGVRDDDTDDETLEDAVIDADDATEDDSEGDAVDVPET
jgi:hypothetical protein